MPSGLCEACEAFNLQPIEVKVKDLKTAVRNGFKPRYGRAVFESNLMHMVGADFGVPGLAPNKKEQKQRHAADVAKFIAKIQDMEDDYELSLCSICAEDMKKFGRKWWQFYKK